MTVREQAFMVLLAGTAQGISSLTGRIVASVSAAFSSRLSAAGKSNPGKNIAKHKFECNAVILLLN